MPYKSQLMSESEMKTLISAINILSHNIFRGLIISSIIFGSSIVFHGCLTG